MTASAGRRVLMLLENSTYPRDARVRREALTLTEAGYEVTVICPAADGQPKTSIEDGVRVRRFPRPAERDGIVGYVMEYGMAMWWFAVKTLGVALRRRFHVIHAHNPPDLMCLVAAPYKLLGVKFVFDHHDLSPEMYDARFRDRARPVVHRALEFVERISFRLADGVISTNESYAEIARSRGGVDPDRVTVVRNGPDLTRVKPHPIDPELSARARTIIGYVGEMANQDGVDSLIRSLGILRGLGEDDFLAVLVGTGSAVESLAKLVEDTGLADHVEFAGHVSDERLMTILSTADICVVPDPTSPFVDRSTMIKLLEYMALGKPSVAFDLTEHRRSGGEAALYARPDDEEDFARQIQRLMHDEELRAQMGAEGRRRVETSLAWPFQAPHLVTAYAALFRREL